MFRSKGSVAVWVLGGLTIFSLAYFIFSSWFSTPGAPRIEYKPETAPVKIEDEIEELEDDEEEEEEEAEVEDVDEEEEEEEAQAPAKVNVEDQMATMKAQYDAASKDCSALIAAQKFNDAVEKLNELIGLAGKVQRGQAEIVTLYNNRSAMFEKLQDYERSLSDIRVMLMMQPDHVRARTRRGRIYEAQNELNKAVEEYVICNWIEQARQERPSNEARANALFKKIAIQQAAEQLNALRSEVFADTAENESSERPLHSNTTNIKDKLLPSKAYTKNVLETFPNTYTWRRLVDQTTRASLLAKLQDAKDSFNLVANDGTMDILLKKEKAFHVLQSGLEVVQLDLAQDNVSQGFGMLRSVEDAARFLYTETEISDGKKTVCNPDDILHRQHLSQFYELLGTEAQFKSLSGFALRCYRHSYALTNQNFTVQLKLAALYSELEVETAASAIYERLITADTAAVAETNNNANNDDNVSVASKKSTSSVSSHSCVVLPLGLTLDMPQLRLAWTQLHQAALLVQRQADGQYLPDAASKAVEALENYVLAPLDGEGSAESLGAQFIAHVKIVNILTHTKAAMEQQSTDEDNAKCRACIQSAKLLDPEHDSVMLLEAEQLSHEGDVDGALALLEKVKRRLRVKKRIADPEASDVVFMVAKASVLSAQAFQLLQQGNMAEAHNVFSEVDNLYKAALVLDPTAIEVMAQQAQLRSMIFADFDEAVRLIEQALPLFRSRDELQDILQMLVTFKANQKGLQFLRSGLQDS